MNRNRLFMWAYISFIVIATVLRVFISFPLWQPIVIAITVSGIFFSIEQLFSLLYSKFTELVVSNDFFLAKVEDNVSENIEACNHILESVKKNAPLSSEMEENIVELTTIVKELNSFLEPIEKTKAIQKRNIRKQRLYLRLSLTFSYLGFFVLLVSLIFFSIVEIPKLLQDILTVIPFSIILVSQQIEPIIAEKNERYIKSGQHTIMKYKDFDLSAKEYIQKFQYLCSLTNHHKINEEK